MSKHVATMRQFIQITVDFLNVRLLSLLILAQFFKYIYVCFVTVSFHVTKCKHTKISQKWIQLPNCGRYGFRFNTTTPALKLPLYWRSQDQQKQFHMGGGSVVG